jgi:DNA-binding NarL/FixJ family response regulator
MIRVVIGDDHGVVREGLVALLQRESDIQVLAQAQNGLDLVRVAREHGPDVVVADVSMPVMNGVEAIHHIRHESPRSKVLCLSVSDQTRQVLTALEAGAAGYVLKENSFEELARGISRVAANQMYLSSELVGAVRAASRHGASGGETPLTARERQVAQLFSEGYSTLEIAGRLHVSSKTVATHREHLFHKLKIQSIAELTRYALREGLSALDLPSRQLTI